MTICTHCGGTGVETLPSPPGPVPGTSLAVLRTRPCLHCQPLTSSGEIEFNTCEQRFPVGVDHDCPGPIAPMRAELEALVDEARRDAAGHRHAAEALERYATGVSIILERYAP